MLKSKSELLQKEKNIFSAKSAVSRYQRQAVKAHKQSKELLASPIFKDAANGD